MSDTTFGLDAATLERAAEAIYSTYETITTPPKDDWGNFVELSSASMVRAALPVIAPAIREAMVREMMADADEGRDVIDRAFGVGGSTDQLIRWLEFRLPATDEQGAPR